MHLSFFFFLEIIFLKVFQPLCTEEILTRVCVLYCILEDKLFSLWKGSLRIKMDPISLIYDSVTNFPPKMCSLSPFSPRTVETLESGVMKVY